MKVTKKLIKEVVKKVLNELNNKPVDVKELLQIAKQIEKDDPDSLFPRIIRDGILNYQDMMKIGRPKSANKWLQLSMESALEAMDSRKQNP